MVRLEDIAREAGVSIGTVQRALYNKGRIAASTKQRVLETADRLGYQPNMIAKALATKRKSLTLGFIYVDDDFSPLQRVIAADAKEYAAALEDYGVSTIFIPLQGHMPDAATRRKKLFDTLRQHPFDGIAALGPVASELNAVRQAEQISPIPLVTYHVESEKGGAEILSHIGCDFTRAGRMAAGLAGFALNGKGRVCIVSVDYPELSSTTQRISGFMEEIAEKYPDVEVTGTLLFSPDQDPAGGKVFAEACERFLREQENPDIIYFLYAANDAFSQSMADLGKAGKSRIITSDPATDVQRKLLREGEFAAAVVQDTHELGQKVLDILFQYAAYGTLPEQERISTKLELLLPESIPDTWD